MKIKVSLVACIAAPLFVAFPLVGQTTTSGNGGGNDGNNGNHANHGNGNGNHGHGNNGHHNPKGNGSDHTGHKPQGHKHDHNNHHGDKDLYGDDHYDGHYRNPHKGAHGNLVLGNQQVAAGVGREVASVTTALRSASLTTVRGRPISPRAQEITYAILTRDASLSGTTAELSAVLSAAGTEATAIVPSLVRTLSGLGSDPARLPSALVEFNRFTKAASNAFISQPPPEFLALHATLARLTAAAVNGN